MPVYNRYLIYSLIIRTMDFDDKDINNWVNSISLGYFPFFYSGFQFFGYVVSILCS